MKNFRDISQQLSYDLDLSSTAYLQSIMAANRFAIYYYIYRTLADFYLFEKLAILALVLIHRHKINNYFWTRCIVLYVNNVIMLLFLLRMTATLLPNGELVLFMHLVFIDVLIRCTIPEGEQPHLFYGAFFADSICNVRVSNLLGIAEDDRDVALVSKR